MSPPSEVERLCTRDRKMLAFSQEAACSSSSSDYFHLRSNSWRNQVFSSEHSPSVDSMVLRRSCCCGSSSSENTRCHRCTSDARGMWKLCGGYVGWVLSVLKGLEFGTSSKLSATTVTASSPFKYNRRRREVLWKHSPVFQNTRSPQPGGKRKRILLRRSFREPHCRSASRRCNRWCGKKKTTAS